MNMEPNDILVLGGKEILPSKSAFKIRQIPFTLLGLGETHHLIPECKIVIYCPNRSIFSGRLSKEDIQGIETLFNIAPSELEEEFTPEQEEGLRLLCLRKAFSDLGLVLSAGGQLAVCFPEDFPDWTPTEKDLVTLFLPAMMVTRDEKWMHRLDGPPDLLGLTVGLKSSLVFTVNRSYLMKHERIFDSNFFPPEINCSMMDSVELKDRKGQGRIVRMRIGFGKLVLCPELYWDRFLISIGAIPDQERDIKPPASDPLVRKEIAAVAAETKTQAEHVSKQPLANMTVAAPGISQAAESSKRQHDSGDNMGASQSQPENMLQALLPRNPKTLSNWNKILRWNGRGAIRSVEELAEYLDHCAHIRESTPHTLGEKDMPPTKSTRYFDPNKFRSLMNKKRKIAEENGNKDLIAFIKKANGIFCHTIVKV